MLFFLQILTKRDRIWTSGLLIPVNVETRRRPSGTFLFRASDTFIPVLRFLFFFKIQLLTKNMHNEKSMFIQ